MAGKRKEDADAKRDQEIDEALDSFGVEFEPFEIAGENAGGKYHLFHDNRTYAAFVECHVKASKLVTLGTVDVPLDPEEQAEYRANREIVENAYAFEVMKEDAKKRRSFSNIVTEYNKAFDAAHPLKVIDAPA